MCQCWQPFGAHWPWLQISCLVVYFLLGGKSDGFFVWLEYWPCLLVTSLATGMCGGTDRLLGASGLIGQVFHLTAHPPRRGASDGLSLLRGESFAAPGVLIGARSSWPGWQFSGAIGLYWHPSYLVAYFLLDGATNGLSLQSGELSRGPCVFIGVSSSWRCWRPLRRPWPW